MNTLSQYDWFSGNEGAHSVKAGVVLTGILLSAASPAVARLAATRLGAVPAVTLVEAAGQGGAGRSVGALADAALVDANREADALHDTEVATLTGDITRDGRGEDADGLGDEEETSVNCILNML